VVQPEPNAPVVGAAPAEPAPVSAPPAPAAPPAPPASPAPPRIELPSSNAAYLNNPAPAYPALSKRMGEQGKVLLRVLISADGRPEQVEIRQSSGFDRLDRQAQETVMRWRFVPGKRNGVAEAMWYLVPINFVLE
jgi:protein TonB